MTKIQPLSAQLIAKIAAGEVIERPVYAIKELIDNSIDAGSTDIRIEIETGPGIKKITVSDNGWGMSKEDLAESFKIHTTSKLTRNEDLSSIQTLGFRGEALASMAAISDLQISSRTKNNLVGRTVHLQAGKVTKTNQVGMATGTIVSLSNIFSKTPARYKSAQNLSSEMRLLMEVLTGYGLKFNNIRFTLVNNKKLVLDLVAVADPIERIKKLLGSNTLEKLVPLKYKDSYFEISGFTSKPELTAKSTSKSYLFVNGRKVTDKLLDQTVRQGYGSLLTKDSWPIVILFLSLPFDLVDVNVHPRKERISFINPQLVSEIVTQAVRQSLNSYNLAPKIKISRATDSYMGQLLKDESASWPLKPTSQITKNSKVTQIKNLYLMMETTHGLLIIDQHAADERVLYEQFLKDFDSQKQSRGVISTNKVIEVSLSEAKYLENYLTTFADVGFIIEPFGQTAFKVISVPTVFQDYDLPTLINEMLEDIQENNKVKSVDLKTEKMLTFLACRAAVKAGQKLTQKEAVKLIEKLELTPNNSTCPHGRPTKVELSILELNRLFKR